jgi:hypothetical protein
VTGQRSNQLSYSPTIVKLLVAGQGLEPRPPGYEPDELPLLYPAIFFRLAKQAKGIQQFLALVKSWFLLVICEQN